MEFLYSIKKAYLESSGIVISLQCGILYPRTSSKIGIPPCKCDEDAPGTQVSTSIEVVEPIEQREFDFRKRLQFATLHTCK